MNGLLRAKLFILLILLFASTTSFALPFSITPKQGISFPTTYGAGQTLFAYYTVLNNTGSQRNNNFVRYLPPNVVQVTSGGTYGDTCGATFNLSQNGTANSSCTLQLKILGTVDASDTDQSHHLFVCFPGGKTCAGTSYPLNITEGVTLSSITVTPVSAAINTHQTQQYTATENFSNGTSTDVTLLSTWTSSNPTGATITQTGLATGVTGSTTTLITANYEGLSSTPVTLNINKTLLSISLSDVGNTMLITRNQQLTVTGTYDDGTTANITSNARFTNTNPAAVTVSTGGLATAVARGNTAITAAVSNPNLTSNTLAVNTVVTGYIGQYNAGNSYSCTVNPDGSLTNCVGTMIGNVSGLSINADFTQLFTGQTTTSKYCAINLDGTIGTCNNIGAAVNAIVFNTSRDYAYLLTDQYPYSNIMGCQFNAASNSFSGCVTYPVSIFNSPANGAVSPNGNYFYEANSDNYSSRPKTITSCSINNNNLTACTNTGVGIYPFALAINPAGTFIFTADYTTTGSILSCALSSTTGAITNCQSGGQTFPNVLSLATDPAGTFLYVATSSNGVYYCQLNNTTGLYSSCVATANISITETEALLIL